MISISGYDSCANSADSGQRENEDDKKFTDYKERIEDKVIAKETDQQSTRHLSCPWGAVLALLYYFHISRPPHLLANQAEVSILNYLS